jgi:membrane protease subunit HflK
MFLQTMESVFGRSPKVLMDAQSDGNVFYLPLDAMTGAADDSDRAPIPPVLMPQSGQDSNGSTTATRTPRREGRQ